jgi:hypothetical protein
MNTRYVLASAAVLGVLTLPLACSDSTNTTSPNGTGTMVVRLTDAPFLSDSVKSVDVFVVRVDGRTSDVDSATADSDLDNGASGGWTTLATPNSSFNLLALQNGVSTTLGTTSLAAGTYNGFRFIIDPTKSSVTLNNGTVLTSTSSPSVTFPSAAKSGIKIVLAQPVQVAAGATTTLLVDFDVNNSFVQRGNSIRNNGLLFKPVIKATVINAATVNATVRLVNATGTALNFLQSGAAMSGGSNIAFGTSSSCASVNATNPTLSVTQGTSTTALTGFSPTLTAGTSYNIVAYPTATGGVQFATLINTFTPTTGQAGLRVFNASGLTAASDVFVTASGAALTTPTISSTASGNSSTFVSVPAGSSQIRLTAAGTTTTLLDLGSQTFTAGQNATLVIAPPLAGSVVPRAFLVTGC